MKIAPTLTMLVTRYWARTGPGSRPAKRELDALLAVARAAKGFWQPCRDGTDYDAELARWEEKMVRALARLEKVSGRKP